MTAKRILLIEDDSAIRFAVRDFLESSGYQVSEADSCASGERAFADQRPNAVITDYKLPDGDALDLLPKLRAISATAPIVMLTGHGSVELAVRAIREGADDFLTKPVALPALQVVLERAFDRQRDRQSQMARLARQRRVAVDPFLGSSPAIQKMRDVAQRIAETDRPVLILGETGSGKGVLTRWVHANGPRVDEPFVDLNCASLPRELLESELFGYERGAFTGAVAQKMGLVELANRGTLFLDEIGDLEPALQPKLLKVLEDQSFRRVGAVRDRHVDVRLIAATHQDLPKLVSDNRFRSDLYFRISTLPIYLPALRERLADLPVLARDLLDRLSADLGKGPITLEPDAMAALSTYHWPGNIRELRNVLERATLLSARSSLRAQDLMFDRFRSVVVGEGLPEGLDCTLDELNKQHITRVMNAVGGHVEQAAARLGIPRSTLYQKVKAMQIPIARGARST